MTKVGDALNQALHAALAADERVLILGEDLLDPYGGAFKVTRGLSDAFPGRVITTPVSEGAIVGLAGGMAIRGLRPVVEIMFGDFTTLIADQVVNHLTKYEAMYDGHVTVPVVIRTPMGGRRGYGATHSQSIEKLFLGVPGLRVLAPSALGDPGRLLRAAIDDDGPVLFVENKVLYLAEVDAGDAALEVTPAGGPSDAPSLLVRVAGAGAPTVTLTGYGQMAALACEAVRRLAYEHELVCELVVPTQLAPLDADAVLSSVRGTGRLLTVEESPTAAGWGAEVVAVVAGELGVGLRRSARVGAPSGVIPAAGHLEAAWLPGVDDIVKMALELR